MMSLFEVLGDFMVKVGEAATTYSIWWLFDEPTCPKELQK